MSVILYCFRIFIIFRYKKLEFCKKLTNLSSFKEKSLPDSKCTVNNILISCYCNKRIYENACLHFIIRRESLLMSSNKKLKILRKK